MSKPTDKTTTSQGCAPQDVIFGITEIEGGFPHSEICGSKVVRTSPQLIAAYHVLHRLSAPRHPPDTLIALDRSHYQYPPPEGPRQRPSERAEHEVQQGYDRKDQFCFKHARERAVRRRPSGKLKIDGNASPQRPESPGSTHADVGLNRCMLPLYDVRYHLRTRPKAMRN